MNGVSPGSATPPFGEGAPRDWLCLGLARVRVGPSLLSFWREFAVWGNGSRFHHCVVADLRWEVT